MDKIDLVPIKELLDKKFFITSYQRGYRWTRQQVIDLLEDIKEFKENGANGIYCIQPLVVKGRPKEEALNNIQKLFGFGTQPTLADIQKELHFEKWDVIDGQQRLTTIKILLSYLQKDTNTAIYNLEYETRQGSNDFLNAIATKEEQDASHNIDFYHMKKAYDTIKGWFEGYVNDKGEIVCPAFSGDKTEFLKILKDKVQFIWYETEETDPIKVFTRLNIGKIALTDAELIKALFLNQSNFKSENKDAIRLQQIEIANEWDRIEYTLQNDEFWLFIQNIGYTKPTRIDFIFDYIRKKQVLGDMGDCGNDTHQAFRYFYKHFQRNKTNADAEWLRMAWHEVKKLFQIVEEWYNDLELYHYVGFLTAIESNTLEKLMALWHGTKEDFKAELKKRIKDKLKGCCNLTAQYEIENNPKKTVARPVLLLHNIQTIVSQHHALKDNSRYNNGVFVKFPFHLFKKEGWDVEHIDSNTTNDLTDFASQREYLLNCYLGVNESKQAEFENFINHAESLDDEERLQKFKTLTTGLSAKSNMNMKQKNQLMNFTLLDSSTNRSYGNSIFPAKRRIIKGKDRGRLIPMPKIKEGKLDCGKTKEAKSAFIPLCTKQVFMKYYSDEVSSSTEYTLEDAKAYLLDINNVLSEAGFINDQSETIKSI